MAWLELSKTWHDTNVEYCDVCGNLLIRRAWVFETADGRTLRACRESDERLNARLAELGSTIEDAVQALDWHQGELVLVGSSRLAAPRRLFLGSTAAKMLRELPVPMIVVPRTTHGKASQ